MVVLTLSNCPPKLKGDLTRWLFEIDTGVFVGNVSARVRDSIWIRVCDNIDQGRATMAFSSNGEQKLDFRIHNTNWEPVDFDGIKLVRRNMASPEIERKEKLKALQNHINRNAQINKQKSTELDSYIVIDIETTGLAEDSDIIEIGGLLIENGSIERQFEVLVHTSQKIPDEVINLTGITQDMLEQEGKAPREALEQFLGFCGDHILVGHNILFDIRFLQKACIEHGVQKISNKVVDTMKLARRKVHNSKGYSLTAIADCLGIEYGKAHRAIDDCTMTYRIYEKLKKN